MNEVSALIKGTPESSLSLFLPFENTEGRLQCGIQNQALTRTQSSWRPDLGLPASRTVRNKCSLFKPPSLWYNLL